MRTVIARSIGVLGELLITAAALIGLFLVWQLWWTDVEATRTQDRILTAVQTGWTPAPTQPAPQRRDPPPVSAPGAMHEVWGILHIPRFDRPAIPLAEGVSLPKVLNTQGAGHYPGTAMPGEVGNFSVAGHRTTYGKPFYEISELTPGDPIIVETADAFYVYRVTSQQIIRPHQVEVIAPVPNQPGAAPNRRMLTLTACHPLFSARERYVVHAEFDYWTVRNDGLPPDLLPPELPEPAPNETEGR